MFYTSSAEAMSKNRVAKVVSLANDGGYHQVGPIIIQEDNDYPNDFTSGDTFYMTLPTGAEWDTDSFEVTVNGAIYDTCYKFLNNQNVEITLCEMTDQVDQIVIKPRIKFDPTLVFGDLKLTIDGRDSAITHGEFLIARVVDGGGIVIAYDTPKINKQPNQTCSMIEIDEAAVSSFGVAKELGGQIKKIMFTLPVGVTWNAEHSQITLSGGFSNFIATLNKISDRELEITISAPPDSLGERHQRGILKFNPVVDVCPDFNEEHVYINVRGQSIDTTDLVIATFPQELIINSVTPKFQLLNYEPFEITILGIDFKKGATVKIGDLELYDVVVANAGKIIATVPAGLTGGLYDLIVMNPDGSSGTLKDAFSVTQDECFIATAAFGSKLEPAVVLLRSFRDQFLLTNTWGQTFVKFYYHHSPPIASFIADNEAVKWLVRVGLVPIVGLAYLLLHPLLLAVITSGLALTWVNYRKL